MLRVLRNTNKYSHSLIAFPGAPMAERRSGSISTRKQPQQARSTELVAAILEAAVQVLAKQGAQRFTTARVADKAGVSVGSLYQYFPNKAAILFRLQSDEWRQTSQMLRDILEDRGASPPQRLRRLVHAFIQSECDEAEVRGALDDAAPLYRDAPEARAARKAMDGTMAAFLREAAPQSSEATRARAAQLIGRTIAALGKDFSSRPRKAAEITAYADSVADMLCAYLKTLRRD